MKDLGVLKPTIRLSITNPASESGSVFGRGIANLCLGVREAGSLNAAAKGMGMAYSKAWRIIKETEAALGIQLLNRDGAHGSTLTEEGDALLDAYISIDAQLQKDAERNRRPRIERAQGDSDEDARRRCQEARGEPIERAESRRQRQHHHAADIPAAHRHPTPPPRRHAIAEQAERDDDASERGTRHDRACARPQRLEDNARRPCQIAGFAGDRACRQIACRRRQNRRPHRQPAERADGCKGIMRRTRRVRNPRRPSARDAEHRRAQGARGRRVSAIRRARLPFHARNSTRPRGDALKQDPRR